MIRITYRENESLSYIKDHYVSFGYDSEILEDDTYLLAYDDIRLVAIVRVSTEMDQAVLRGMFIDNEYRRKGIGSQMIKELAVFIDKNFDQCFCIPLGHLGPFYQQIGFEKITDQEAPLFIQKRIDNYRQSEMDVLLMKRVSIKS